MGTNNNNEPSSSSTKTPTTTTINGDINANANTNTNANMKSEIGSESEQAKEQRLREKLKRKAEEMNKSKGGEDKNKDKDKDKDKSKDETKDNGKDKASERKDNSKDNSKDKDNNNDKESGGSKSRSNRNRNRRRQRGNGSGGREYPSQQGQGQNQGYGQGYPGAASGYNNMDNRRNYEYGGGMYGPPMGGGGNGPPDYGPNYRGLDPYGRGDWRRDGPYDHRNGHGWRGGGGGGYDRPVDGYWGRDGHGHGHGHAPYYQDRDRFGREWHGGGGGGRDSSARGAGGNSLGGVSGNGNNGGNSNGSRDGTRKDRGRSRSSHSQSHSQSHSLSRSRSASDRSYSTSSYGSRSSSRSRSVSHSRSRSSGRSRSRSSSCSLRSRSLSHSRSRSRSRSTNRSPDDNHDRHAHAKRSRSASSDVPKSDTSKRRRSQSPTTSTNTNKNTNTKQEGESDALTKDQRTIFVSQLVMKAGEREIRKYFRKNVGCRVNDVQLLRDKRTGRHKGCAYVELGRLEDVPKAIQISGKTPDFQRFPILIKASEAEKNYTLEEAVVMDGLSSAGGVVGVGVGGESTNTTKRIEAQKVYVGSIDRNVTQAQLYAIFSKFGELEKAMLQMDTATSVSKGYAFLSFKCPKVANLAIQAMSGQILAGRQLRTGWANLNTTVPNLQEVASSEFPDDAVTRVGKVNDIFTKLNGTGLAHLAGLSLVPGMTPTGTLSSSDANTVDDQILGVSSSSLTTQQPSASITDAAEEAINAALAGISSHALPLPLPPGDVVAKAPEEVSLESAPTSLSHVEATNNDDDDPHKVSGQMSTNILVRNMFNKDEETEEGWEEEIKLDFEEESGKHGKIVSCKVMSKEVGGKIYAGFETVEGAKACAKNLAGRWFDKRQLRVEYVSDEEMAKIV